MSIIEQEAERLYPDLVFPGYPRDQKHFQQVYTSDDLQEAYMQGALRKPTALEAEAAAMAIFQKSWVEIHNDPTMSWENDLNEEQRTMYTRIALFALKAAREKADENE